MPPIDRRALVARHNPRNTHFAPLGALAVGNGEFAFTADATGLQTFPELYDLEFPLGTTAQWAWHSAPLPPDTKVEEFRYEQWDTYGRDVPYPTSDDGQKPLYDWLDCNPHHFHLGRIGFVLTRANGTAVTPGDIEHIEQTLDLWSGQLFSSFRFDGHDVAVETLCHPTLDLLAVRVASPLLASGHLKIKLTFALGSHLRAMADWNAPDGAHQTEISARDAQSATIKRAMDDTRYLVQCAWNAGEFSQTATHEFELRSDTETLEFACGFAPGQTPSELPDFAATQSASAAHWRVFWQNGGAVDLSESTDPRAHELERRIVLSQFNTAIHCAGSLPPQETGLLFNSWNGKFHLEMHFWHAAHFAYWNRLPLLERSLGYYRDILPRAQAWAKTQGYSGARWPKMVGPEGRDSPSTIGPLLIWQQPHPIYYAEQIYRARPTRATLEAWREIVMETAEWMSSYAVWQDGHYHLGPPLLTIAENTHASQTRDPTFELSYWRFGLRVAQRWRERLGLAREAQWDEVLNNLAPLPQHDDCYLQQEGLFDTYTKWNWEHPGLVGALGVLPGDGVDLEMMRRTIFRVRDTWVWERASWGWDYPMAALCAARCGESELAVELLLLDKPRNRLNPNGHNWQWEALSAYLPGNGALLLAIAGMCAGFGEAADRSAPGFPASWKVRYEGLKPLI